MQRFLLIGFLLAPGAAAQAAVLGDEATVERTWASNKSAFTAMLQPDARINAGALNAAADYYVYRSTWPGLRKNEDPEKGMPSVLKSFETMAKSVQDSKNDAMRNAFVPILVTKFESLTNLDFKNDEADRRSILHGIQMFPALGKMRHDRAADYFFKLLAGNETHEAVKLYAIKGLREHYPLTTVHEGNKNQLNREDPKRIETLIAYIFRVRPNDMDEGAFVFFRREAIATLAATRVPAVAAIKTSGKAQGVVAASLMRILSEEPKMTPMPTFAEKMEASLGLLTMEFNPEFVPDLAQYYAGRFLLEFEKEYRQAKKPATVAWKVQGRRFDAAVKAAKKNYSTELSTLLAGKEVGDFLKQVQEAKAAPALPAKLATSTKPAPKLFRDVEPKIYPQAPG